MKKYIMIAGVPRAGKSTLSQMLAKETGYQHISMDSIIAGIEKIFPETRIHTEAATDMTENLAFISARIAPFIRAMIESGEYDECDYGAIIDVYQLLPADYIRYLSDQSCEIYYLLSSDVTPEERCQLLNAFDTPKDYTYFDSDEDKRRACEEIVRISLSMKEQCLSCGLPYFETSHDRMNLLNACVAQICGQTDVSQSLAASAKLKRRRTHGL